MTPVRIVRPATIALLALAAGAAGCATASMNPDVQALEQQVQILQSRIDHLEQERGIAPAVSSRSAVEEGAWQADAERQAQTGGAPQNAFMKGFRGGVNLLTGWVEIPKRIQETTERSGVGAGLTWGLLRGLGYGFIRTAGGLYELVTFPFPAPADFRPIIEPPFVF